MGAIFLPGDRFLCILARMDCFGSSGCLSVAGCTEGEGTSSTKEPARILSVSSFPTGF